MAYLTGEDRMTRYRFTKKDRAKALKAIRARFARRRRIRYSTRRQKRIIREGRKLL